MKPLTEQKMYSVLLRFSDIDAYGHVHNAAYFHFFESARVQYFQEILGQNWDWQNEGVVLVENHAQYLNPVYFEDHANISIRVTKIGNKSFTLTYHLWVNGKEHCRGSSTLVCYNHTMKQSIALPEKLKTALNQLI